MNINATASDVGMYVMLENIMATPNQPEKHLMMCSLKFGREKFF
jgi:hypothetical protein